MGSRSPHVRVDGLLRTGLRTQGHRCPCGLPGDTAGRRRSDRGRGRGGRRILNGHLDCRLDRSTDGKHSLPGQGYRVEDVPGRPGEYFAYVAYDIDLFEESSIANLDLVDHRQCLRVQAAEGAAARGHANSGRVRQDLPGSAARNRDGAGVPEQVRPAAAGRDGEAQARALRPELRPGDLRGLPRRPGFHQGRREHQLPALHALARSLPVRHGRCQQGDGGHRRDQGPLLQCHRRHDRADVRARGVRRGTRQRRGDDRPDDRIHCDAVDVALGAEERRAAASAPGRAFDLHQAEDARRQLPGAVQVVPADRRRPSARRHRHRQARGRSGDHQGLLRHAARRPHSDQPRATGSSSTRTGRACPA